MRSKWLVVLFAVLTCAITVVPAFADGPSDPPGHVQTYTQPSPQEIAKARKKETQVSHIMDMLKRYKEGKTSYTALEKTVQKFNDEWAGGKPARDTIDKLMIDDPYLGLTTEEQANSYYCGPASVYMVLNYRGVSYKPGNPSMTLSQANLASYEELRTDALGETDWTRVPTVLDNWLATSWYVNTWSPSASDIIWMLHWDYADNYPVIFDVRTVRNGSNLLGWSRSTMHYLAGDGFDYDTSTVHYYDPYDTGYDSLGPHWIGATDMENLAYERGITW